MKKEMTFDERVGILCAAMGVSNPPQEDELRVRAVACNFGGDNWQSIEGYKQNIGGRLFLQSFIGKSDKLFVDIEGNFVDMLRHQAAEFYRERWNDTEQVGRPLLVALKTAKLVRVFQKVEMLSEAA